MLPVRPYARWDRLYRGAAAPFLLLTGAALVAFALAGCGGDDDNPGGPGGGPTSGPMTAMVNGRAFVAQAGYVTAQALTTPGGFALSGTDPGWGSDAVSIQLYLYNIGGPGTYPLGVGPSVYGGIASVGMASGDGWGTPGDGADGTVTITALSATQIAGTFSFTAEGLTGDAMGTWKVVTDGQFDLVLPGTPLPPLPDNAGGRLGATVGGVSFNAVNLFATMVSGTLILNGGNNAYGIGIHIDSFAGAGTYPLTNVMPLHTVTASKTAGGTWGAGTGASGSIVITSATATRVTGTFSGTLAPVVGTTTPILVTDGSFSAGLP